MFGWGSFSYREIKTPCSSCGSLFSKNDKKCKRCGYVFTHFDYVTADIERERRRTYGYKVAFMIVPVFIIIMMLVSNLML